MGSGLCWCAMGVEQLRATQFRIDSVDKTASGSLRLRGKLTRTGVFEYMRGTERVRELRGDAEVFAPESIDTLVGAHVTVDHPRDFVGSDNWKVHSVGTVIRAEADPPYVVGELVVHDARAQHQIEQGYLKEISCGYFCTPKTVDGQDADVAQTGIRYNHAALGPEGWGRLGSDVGLTFDSNGDQELSRFLHDAGTNNEAKMSEDREAAEVAQDELPLVEPPPLRVDVAKLSKKVDGIAEAFSRWVERQETQDKAEPAYTELAEQPTADELKEQVERTADAALDLELRARAAYETVYPTRRTIDNRKRHGAQYCEEILGVDSNHDLQLKDLVERAEISADTVRRERAAIQKAEDSVRRSAALGIPVINTKVSPLRAKVLGE